MTKAQLVPTLSQIQQWDDDDPMSHMADFFELPSDIIYLDGNSLGALPKNTAQHVHTLINKQWGQDLISSWNKHQWINKPTVLGNQIGQLIGADKGQTLVCDSTSINIFKLASAAVKMQPTRTKIITEVGNFATDIYMLQGLQALLGDTIDIIAVPRDKVATNIDSTTALVLLTHVHYKSGAIWDMQNITQLAHQHGALILWDLSHSVGAMPLHLDTYQVDFAVGCTYKYLNGGPGSPAFLYINQQHHTCFQQPLSGWLGHQQPFAFEDNYRPAAGVQSALCGTPSIIAYSPLEAALSVFAEVDLQVLRYKGKNLTSLFIQLVNHYCPTLTLASPMVAEQRGNHVAFMHADAYAIVQNLIQNKVIGDFRAPNIMRFGFSPLYISYQNVWHSVQELKTIIDSASYLDKKFALRHTVT